ncbi:hypothetical protein DV532_25635 (plasmid) [Pseudomonas sp. Leaf58]|uniref:hypothetical protein n=1 Tax=Pseudomonas sp. Leaf58 TaxID=1736226 RepID=UPI0006FEAECC|nr:hypothetical protein [Pseudomonas sp. Leaf58]AYG47680.1 hypothetical protein DV532_25635 [Pseudomonas sp. Leaf58]KQN62758.1 hypothetical protein ASF02_11475 [Pseudomonas sp. Leaf58]
MQLFSGLGANTPIDQYQVKSWSQALGRETVMASLELDEHGILHVSATDAGAAYYATLGLPEAADGAYVVNLHEAPTSLIAKALGLPGGDTAFERSMAKTTGESPTGYDMLEAALQGHPAQSGRLVAGEEKGSRFVKIDEKQFVEPNATSLPDLASFYVRSQDTYQGMVKTDVLIKDGSEIIPAYIVSVQPGAHENARDRLAIYAATLLEAEKIGHVVADKMRGFTTTADGLPALICQDATRPTFGIVAIGQSARNPNVALVSVEHALLHAKSSVEPAGAFQFEQSQEVIRALAKASALREFAQDAKGLSAIPPGKLDGGVRIGRLDIPRHMTIEYLSLTAQSEAHTLSGPVAALSKRISLNATEVEDQISQLLKAVSRTAAGLVAEIDRTVSAEVSAPEPEKQVKGHNDYGLS